ncbi:M23 family metallopeptidase [Fulvivirgaceae bacterium LMO-SS25]
MARIKYYYDTETCKYERVRVSKWDVFLNFLGFFSVSFILAISILFIYSQYFESPKEAQLKKENEELVIYYEFFKQELDKMNSVIASLEERDDDIYRVIFEAEPIPATIRRGGIGGVDRYKSFKESGLQREELIIDLMKEVDILKRKMYVQTRSHDELMELAMNKEELWAAIPSIQPINNKELNRLASGYGMRTHPILKVKKFHAGVDFSAPRGTPIYSTGDGVIVEVKTTFGGYGKYIEVDHGFGYLTRYAHMSAFEVRKGQKVKRGEKIGYVGSSGQSTSPHLHYEILKDGKFVNPVNYFFQDLTPEEYEKLLELASIENQSLS